MKMKQSFKELLSSIRLLVQDLGENEDIELKMDTLEGQTDYKEWLLFLFNWLNDEEAREAGIKGRLEKLAKRKKSCEKRQESVKALMDSVLIAMNEDKVFCDEFTVSRVNVAPIPIIDDETKIPDKFFKITRKPDLTAIKNAFNAGSKIPGVKSGLPSTTVRLWRK